MTEFAESSTLARGYIRRGHRRIADLRKVGFSPESQDLEKVGEKRDSCWFPKKVGETERNESTTKKEMFQQPMRHEVDCTEAGVTSEPRGMVTSNGLPLNEAISQNRHLRLVSGVTVLGDRFL